MSQFVVGLVEAQPVEYVISVSYGNDSMGLMQWAFERGLKNVTVAYCDTGWAASGWDARVGGGEAHARRLGFNVVRLQSMGMEALVRMKKGFPGNGQQFCTAWLKGLPFLTWIDDVDPDCKAVVMIGKRRAESEDRKDIPEFIDASEYHGGRKVWHPLYLHTETDRNALLARMGVPVLSHRSKECSPCVNANRNDFRNLEEERIECVESLEGEIGQPMFRAAKRGAKGIRQVIAWAKYSPGQYNPAMDDIFEDEGCGSPFGCGL